MRSRHTLLSTLFAISAVAVIPAVVQAQTPVRFSVVGGLSLPMGDLGNTANLGLNIGLRGEGNASSPGWGLRGDVSYDQYDGRSGNVNTYSYLAFAGNLVHREAASSWYEFGGLGVYNSKVRLTTAVDRSDTNLGMQLGAGFEFTHDKRVFTEFGLTSAFTSGRSSLWFPVRVGIRF
jgi:hypothetical protein